MYVEVTTIVSNIIYRLTTIKDGANTKDKDTSMGLIAMHMGVDN